MWLLKVIFKVNITTVNSLIFAGITGNVCVFDAKTCLRGLIFVVSSGLVNYQGT